MLYSQTYKDIVPFLAHAVLESFFVMKFTFIFISRSFDLYVNGGTPYEKGVEVDPSISRRSKYM